LSTIAFLLSSAWPFTLQDFRHNLHDIGEEVWLYGGHSFRRGAAQWYITNENFNIIMLVNVGGWSTEFDAETIVRYIVARLVIKQTRLNSLFELLDYKQIKQTKRRLLEYTNKSNVPSKFV
jgi:hypothetical protein